MIIAIQGTPGSGKTYMLTEIICQALKAGKEVYSNFPLRRGFGRVLARRGLKAIMSTPERVIIEAREIEGRYHYLSDISRVPMERRRIQGCRLLVIDEVHQVVNARTWKENECYLKLFSEHRKMGYDIYMSAQAFTEIDSQVRGKVEEIWTLRALRRLSFSVLFINFPLPLPAAIITKKWPGGKLTLSKDVYLYPAYIRQVYDYMRAVGEEYEPYEAEIPRLEPHELNWSTSKNVEHVGAFEWLMWPDAGSVYARWLNGFSRVKEVVLAS